MNRPRASKLVHFAATLWFILCAGYLLVIALLSAGRSWWFIVSLTPYSALAVFMLLSLYLFAIYRGVARSQKIKIEHILTTSPWYCFFYDTCPFLGAAGGLIAATGTANTADYLLVIATGSLWTTFLVWIIVDPAIGLIEMTLPASRRHRRNRVAQTRLAKQLAHQARQDLLKRVLAEEKLRRRRWTEALKPYAEKLAELTDARANDESVRAQVVDIGLCAWQIGGLGCMKLLHRMTRELAGQKCADPAPIDNIPFWWDGIGNWRIRWPDGITN